MEQSDPINIPKLLQNVGLRVTPQRDIILRLIVTKKGHMSADDIYQLVHDSFPNLSLATVYNTLKSFSEAGLIREINLGNSPSLFDENVSPHHHMVCRKCGKLIDFCLSPNFTSIAEQAHFEIEDCHIEIKGICSDCADYPTNRLFENRLKRNPQETKLTEI